MCYIWERRSADRDDRHHSGAYQLRRIAAPTDLLQRISESIRKADERG